MDGDVIEGSYDGIAMFLDIKESLDEEAARYRQLEARRVCGMPASSTHTLP